ncbi:hypothetical protein AZE42_10387 [Rhizopogon vesiculosus]|uniref:Uncharacterized protein n=1 Tax=Rhizopogon vesiculosus TaxID=180088 RepID=A0A1J8R1Y0_9AGAM|nr:hypothetical protein AZE42_10387 [Rhizopogon vesiculosus]
MSFTFHGSRTPRTPDKSYYTSNPTPLHIRAPALLSAPRSNDSMPVLPRRPSFSSINQPVLNSPSYPRSRAVSTTRAQPQTSAAPAPLMPSRVGVSGTASSSDRSRTVSSGPSKRPSVPGTEFLSAWHDNNTAFASSSQQSGVTSSSSRSRTVSFGPLRRPSVHNSAIGSAHQTGPQYDNRDDPALVNGRQYGTQKAPHTSGKKTPKPTHHQNSHHTNQPPIHQAPAAIQQHPMLKDIALIAAVAAARKDIEEFPWYPVWAIAIKDWMFSNSHTATVACNLAPQYVSQHRYKTHPQGKLRKTWVIPDFVQILQHVKTSSNGSAVLTSQKVVLMVENKPTLSRKHILNRPSPFGNVKLQTGKQAAFAFMADSNLHVIGVIVAYGSRWKYVEYSRPEFSQLKAWTEGGRMGRKRAELLQQIVPEELGSLSALKDQSFELLDHMGLSAQAFKLIARRIKNRESEMWSL